MFIHITLYLLYSPCYLVHTVIYLPGSFCLLFAPLRLIFPLSPSYFFTSLIPLASLSLVKSSVVELNHYTSLSAFLFSLTPKWFPPGFFFRSAFYSSMLFGSLLWGGRGGVEVPIPQSLTPGFGGCKLHHRRTVLQESLPPSQNLTQHQITFREKGVNGLHSFQTTSYQQARTEECRVTHKDMRKYTRNHVHTQRHTN